MFEAINVVVPDGLLIPDLAVVDAEAADTASVTVDAHHVLAAIEIGSPSTRVTDKALKPSLYAAAGIAHYWRVDLETVPRMHAAALQRGAYGRPAVATAGTEAKMTMGFPLTIDPASLTRHRR